MNENKLYRPLIIVCFLAVFGSLTACSTLKFPAVFKIDIAQGSILDADKVKALKPGMTKRQVIYLLGSPLLQDPLQPNRWDYIYSFQSGGGLAKQYSIELWFDGSVLQRVEGDPQMIQPWHQMNKKS